MRNLSLHSAGTVRTNSGVEIEKILASLSTLPEGISSRDSWLFIHCIEEQEVRFSLKTKNFVDVFSLNTVLFRMFERRVVSTKNCSERIFKF